MIFLNYFFHRVLSSPGPCSLCAEPPSIHCVVVLDQCSQHGSYQVHILSHQISDLWYLCDPPGSERGDGNGDHYDRCKKRTDMCIKVTDEKDSGNDLPLFNKE
jgi:hypothetical protein